jgi:hypothetical protein
MEKIFVKIFTALSLSSNLYADTVLTSAASTSHTSYGELKEGAVKNNRNIVKNIQKLPVSASLPIKNRVAAYIACVIPILTVGSAATDLAALGGKDYQGILDCNTVGLMSKLPLSSSSVRSSFGGLNSAFYFT